MKIRSFAISSLIELILIVYSVSAYSFLMLKLDIFIMDDYLQQFIVPNFIVGVNAKL